MLDADVRSAIGKVVEAALSPIEVLGVTLVEGQDHDANDVIFVTVNLPLGTGPLPATNYLRAMNAASQTLLQLHDERMPLFRTVREGEAEPVEEESERAS